VRSKPGKPARSRGPAPKPTVIDVHAHVLVPEVMKRTYEHSQYARAVAGPGGVPEPLFPRMTDVPLRLREMATTGGDRPGISPSIMQQCTYGMEPEEALRMDRLGNDRVAEAVARHPDRLVGLGSLPRTMSRSRPPNSSAACAISIYAASSFPRTKTGSSWGTSACGRSGARHNSSVP